MINYRLMRHAPHMAAEVVEYHYRAARSHIPAPVYGRRVAGAAAHYAAASAREAAPQRVPRATPRHFRRRDARSSTADAARRCAMLMSRHAACPPPARRR